jgi:TniQ
VRFTTTFPILTFNERSLTPALGYVFDKTWLNPHESIVSILWKFARLNALPGHFLTAQAAHGPVDPYEGIEAYREVLNWRRLQQSLRLPRNTLRLSVLAQCRRGAASPYLRFCPPCLRRSYHSVIHQLEPLLHCPVHGCWLQVECPHCAQTTPYRLNARVLDAPFRCSICHKHLAGIPRSLIQFKPLTMVHRIVLMRTALRYGCF